MTDNIKIFPDGATDVDGTGIMGLHAISAVCSETAAGAWELQVELAATGNYDQVKEGCIIAAIVPAPPSASETGGAYPISGTQYLTVKGQQIKSTGSEGTVQGYAWVINESGDYTKIRFISGDERYVLTSNIDKSWSHYFAESKKSRSTGLQLFRVYSAVRSLSGMTVKVSARHWSYSMENLQVREIDEENLTAQEATTRLQENVLGTMTGEIITRVTGGSVKADWGQKNAKQCILDPEAGIVPQAHARLVRDNADYYIIPNTAKEPALTLRYGVNLLGVNWQVRTDGRKYRVIPVGSTEDSGELYLPEIFVDSPNAGESTELPLPSERLAVNVQVGKVIKWATGTEEELTEARCYEIMREQAQQRFTVNQIDQPKVTLTVEFVLLGDTVEYAQYKGLQHVTLYDWVTVDCSPIGLSDTSMQVTSYKWDVLTQQYQQITLGDPFDYSSIRKIPGYEIGNAAITTTKMGGGGGKSVKKTEDDLEKLEKRYTLTVDQTNEHFAILATEEDWSDMKAQYLLTHEAQFEFTARGLTVKATQNDLNETKTLVSQYHTEIVQNATNISMIATVDDLKRAETEKKALFNINADSISAEVKRASAAEGTLSSSIKINADAIALKVNKNDVATQLAVNCGNVSISGGNLVVDGYVTSTGLSTSIAAISELSTGNIKCGDLTANGDITGAGLDVGSSGQIGCGSIDIGSSIHSEHSLKIDNVEQAKFIGTADVNFDRAAAVQSGKDAMGLALNSSNNTVVVSQSTTKSMEVDAAAGLIATASGSYNYVITPSASAIIGGTTMRTKTGTAKTLTLDVGYSYVASGDYVHQYAVTAYLKEGDTTLRSKTVYSGTGAYNIGKEDVDTTTPYNNGYADGWAAAAKGSGLSGNTVTYPSSTVGSFSSATASIDGHSDSYTASSLSLGGTTISNDYSGNNYTNGVQVVYKKSSHSHKNGSIKWS